MLLADNSIVLGPCIFENKKRETASIGQKAAKDISGNSLNVCIITVTPQGITPGSNGKCSSAPDRQKKRRSRSHGQRSSAAPLSEGRACSKHQNNEGLFTGTCCISLNVFNLEVGKQNISFF